MDGEEQAAAQALEDALQDVRAALGPVAAWCEAVGQDAARRYGGDGWGSETDAAYVRAHGVLGRVADAVRKLEFAAREFEQARNSPAG